MAKDGWRKSSFCATGECIEFYQYGDGIVALRNQRNTHGYALLIWPEEWRDFIAGVKAGEFDLPEIP